MTVLVLAPGVIERNRYKICEREQAWRQYTTVDRNSCMETCRQDRIKTLQHAEGAVGQQSTVSIVSRDIMIPTHPERKICKDDTHFLKQNTQYTHGCGAH